MLDIGTRRQLFIDHRFVDHGEGVRLCMNPPVQHPEPVLLPDRDWESHGIGSYNTVMREDGRFRLWYDGATAVGLPTEGARRLCYAESEDGLRFHKPQLDLLPFRGSTANNIVAPLGEQQSLQGATVVRHDAAPEAERYRLWTKFLPTEQERDAGAKAGLWAMHSPDGLRWQPYEGQPNPEGSCDTQNMLFWDDRLDCWVGYTRVSATQHRDEAAEAEGRKRYRSVGRVTSTDFRHWSPLQIVFEADHQDLGMPVPERGDGPLPVLDYYNSCAMKYPWAQDVYLMFPSAFYHWGEDSFPATMDVQLLTSRDGVAWRRAGDRAPFLRQGPDGSRTSGMIMANPWLIPVGDELWLYYAGTARRHVRDEPGARVADQARRSGLFRASLRRDGFVSLDAGYGGGTFTTPLLTFSGRQLLLNCDGSAGGWLQVEILDAEGVPVAGRALGDADAVTGNGVDKPVSWGGDGDLTSLSGTPVRLRFVMRGIKLYSFAVDAGAGDDPA